MGHHAAVGHAGDKDAAAIDAGQPVDLVDQRGDEPDVVHVVALRGPAAMRGVPGLHDPDAVWEDGEERLGVGLLAPTVMRSGVLGAAEPAVQHDDDGQLAAAVIVCRDVEDVRASETAPGHLAIVAAGASAASSGAHDEGESLRQAMHPAAVSGPRMPTNNIGVAPLQRFGRARGGSPVIIQVYSTNQAWYLQFDRGNNKVGSA